VNASSKSLNVFVLLRRIVLGVSCCQLVALTSVRAQSVPETPGRDDSVGICTHFSQNWSADVVMPLIAKSGAGWIRDDLNWADLEHTPGNYQIPAKTRVWLEIARKAGLKTDLILAYGNPAYPDHYDTAAYAKAAGWLAREVANNVQAIEILNEPNNFGFRDLYGGSWNGNEANGSISPYVKKYVEILNAAAKEIKLANPHMTVIGLGAPPPASFRMIALGLAPEVDGLTDHPYGGRLPELIAYPARPDILRRDGIATADAAGTLASQVSLFRSQAKKFGTTEKLWHTEWGYATELPKPGKPGMSEENQAVYILRRLLESEALGVEHTFIYDFKDDGEKFGLIRSDRTPKPAYSALQRLTRVIAGLPMASSDLQARIEVVNDPAVKQEGLGPRCYTFSGSGPQKIAVAFWEAKPWDPNAAPESSTITFSPAIQAGHIFLCNLLSGNQTEIPGQWSKDHRLSVAVPLSGVPQLLIVR
jgi:hypothetical protein